MQTIHLSEADQGKQLQLQTGDRLIITLSANPTTGFNWILQPNDHFKVVTGFSLGDGGAGSTGQEKFELTPLQPGVSGMILLQYRQPWETQAAEKQFNVSYRIS